ncbi:histidine phosphatase family protein [Pseudaquabacterium pictum]|uniref:Histidine phosphatase family protein n=1 Tax=Pseudaquabacterium pictum TaxID=2315236 RepID=A0A480AMR0_9BURK|nr:histidine phosphatase family protein [Rubrivivax pictus]GCL62040.1 histidine phosphatase family protein [Rubrivivax pictus]
MGTLYLVRHGQASFGADNYDQLSPLGVQQCTQLGRYFATKGRRFAAVLTGTLQRQIQSYDAIAEGLGQRQATLQLPGLNEYDSHAVIAAIHPQPLAKADTPEAYRQHFRILRDGLAAWMAGRTQPQGMPSYADFVGGIHDALARVRAVPDGDVLIVSSGGPISTVVAQVLGAPAETSIELNLRIRNSAVSEFAVNPKRLALVTFNTLPHLDSAEHASWVTHT